MLVPGWVSHLEYGWEEPSLAHFYERLAAFARLILFDKRGTGLLDRVAQFPTMEQRMDDVRAVLDAVGSPRAAVMGVSEGGDMAYLFAAAYPERTAAVIGVSTFAKRIWASDYPWTPTPSLAAVYRQSVAVTSLSRYEQKPLAGFLAGGFCCYKPKAGLVSCR